MGLEHSHVADVLDDLGRLYFEQGRYLEAESLSRRSFLQQGENSVFYECAYFLLYTRITHYLERLQ